VIGMAWTVLGATRSITGDLLSGNGGHMRVEGSQGSRMAGLAELERGVARVGMSKGDMAGMALPWLGLASI
jgi:hypothetical protein